MSLSKKVFFLSEAYKLHGLPGFIRTLAAGIRYKNCKRLILVALSNPRRIEKAITASKNHDFHFATPNELREMKEIDEYQIADIDIERVEKDIARCLVQWDGDKLTGYAWVWVSKLAYIDDGVYLTLPDDAIYNYKALTLPEYRGLAFQGLRHLKLLELLKGEGVNRLFGFVDHFNIRSLQGVKKSGYSPVGELVIRKTNNQVTSKLKLQTDFWPGKPI
ncbi:hypothetical protein [Reinekea sp.]|jgi:hypothetical protein|uniref:hypothetical protein n=1 Tax=Reinekea sp. TaxID=1970455 RepID=UPI003989E1D0